MKTNNSPKKGQKVQVTRFPAAIRFQLLQDYFNGCLREKGIILFEYLIAMGAYWLEKKHISFHHSKRKFKRKTGISENTIRALFLDFEDKGFLTTKTTGEKGNEKVYVRLNYTKIASSMALLYGGEEVEHSPQQLERIAERQAALRQLAEKKNALIRQRKAILKT